MKPPLKSVKTSDLQCSLSAMEILSDELFETDRDWEQSVKVKRSVMVSIGPYSESLKERKETLIVSTVCFVQKKGRF
jgi:hypothetical protein